MDKRITLFTFLAIPLLAGAQTWFNDGMIWQTRVSGTHNPVPQVSVVEEMLDGEVEIDGVKAFRLYRISDGADVQTVLANYIRTDGDRVYFRSAQADNAEWYLMYDFGLEPGEGVYVYSPQMVDYENGPDRTYLTCSGVVENDPEFSGWTTMRLLEFRDESRSDNLGEGVWLKGLASVQGLTYNHRFEVDGISSCLLLQAGPQDSPVYVAEHSEVDVVPSAGWSAWGERGAIRISSAEALEVEVFGDNGLLVVRRTVEGPASVAVPAGGVYMVRAGSQTLRVLVP